MNIFVDTEFIEDGHTIELISLGAVRSDGAEFYAESADVDFTRANDWVKANVLPYLTGVQLRRQKIAYEFKRFCGPAPQFWAWCGAFDFVAIAQLYGRMVDAPEGWPFYINELRQLQQMIPVSRGKLPVQSGKQHHALEDARWNQQVYNFLWQELHAVVKGDTIQP